MRSYSVRIRQALLTSLSVRLAHMPSMSPLWTFSIEHSGFRSGNDQQSTYTK